MMSVFSTSFSYNNCGCLEFTTASHKQAISRYNSQKSFIRRFGTSSCCDNWCIMIKLLK